MQTKNLVNTNKESRIKAESYNLNRLNKKAVNLSALSFLFLFIISLNFISAVSPVLQPQNIVEGYVIAIPEINPLKQNQNFTFNFHVFNMSNGYPIDNSSTKCSFHLYDSSGNSLFEGDIPHENTDVVNEWKINISGGNFSSIGSHGYIVQCNSSTSQLSGYANVGFDVTTSGVQSTLGFYFIFLTIIALTFLFGIKMQNAWIMTLGSFLVLLLSFFILINGIDVIKDVTTTRAIGFVVWGISIVLLYVSAQEQLKEGYG